VNRLFEDLLECYRESGEQLRLFKLVTRASAPDFGFESAGELAIGQTRTRVESHTARTPAARYCDTFKSRSAARSFSEIISITRLGAIGKGI
jgi:hypothetical protein